MRIVKTTSNELVLVHSNRLKEWSMGLAIASIGLLPTIFHTSDELFIKMSKVVFIITFILIGLLGIHEEYYIEFNVKKRKMTMEYRNIIEVLTMQPGRNMVLELDQIRGAVIQEIKEKKPLYKLAIDYSDGLKIGVTETCYFFPDQITEIKNSINKWLSDNGIIGNNKNNKNNKNEEDEDYSNDEDDEDYSDDEDEKEKEKVQSIKKRTNKVK
ncbi:hypothetical protein DDB_G0288641 [Dictyostelium discoideum AX4]|uniref:Essential for reactive oxygen species protein n=1 Tax=Dictyostelium discoideum TaxID=44689 RepID=Q54IN9_DICDI|nr:hypothetical protein DDB_G0288641 [Dictyostelium discoideum AX4]EAL63124.1 hypothetical protein DDB_G0288641 [Dictyostelium discoideum AX4]|eukprot:XP_636619.1 hypothetical protein DDB_G0288641 [Dictyostelium discoideum AX4]